MDGRELKDDVTLTLCGRQVYETINERDHVKSSMMLYSFLMTILPGQFIKTFRLLVWLIWLDNFINSQVLFNEVLIKIWNKLFPRKVCDSSGNRGTQMTYLYCPTWSSMTSILFALWLLNRNLYLPLGLSNLRPLLTVDPLDH